MKSKVYYMCVVLLMIACGSSLTGLAMIDLDVLATNNSTEIGNALNEGQLTFSKAKIVLSEIEFELASSCDSDEGEIEYEGPYIINLLTRQSTPSLNEIQIEPGRYCQMKLKLDKLDDDELPAGISASNEMVDLSVLIEGQNDEGTQFSVRIEEDEEYELESIDSNGFLLDADVTKTLFLVFDLGRLFNGIDFDSLDVSDDLVVIDEDTNEDVYELIVENLKNFSNLKSDSDDDDEYDDDDEDIAD